MPKLMKLRQGLGTVIDNFWSFTKMTEGGCIEWTEAKMGRSPSRNYGYVPLGMLPNGRPMGETAHRLAWILETGEPIPEGMFVCHRCDNPPCCNPDHLFLGTRADNTTDMWQKGRHAKNHMGIKGRPPITHCDNGHDLTDHANRKHTKVGTACRICNGRGRSLFAA